MCTMRWRHRATERGRMTSTIASVPTLASPLSRATRIGVGLSLVTAGLTNGLAQYLGEVYKPDDLEDFSAQIRWGVDHPGAHAAEQIVLLVSMLVLPLGFLGLASITRWTAPRLTAVAIVLTLWGMWGFHTVVALGYGAGTVGPDVIGADAAVALNDGYLEHTGTMITALLPHLIGSFFGLLLLAIAGIRGGLLPRIPLVLLIAFLVWDFFLPAGGPVEPHLLLAVALGWLGIHVLRLPQAVWQYPRHGTVTA
jgi:hypothetical protein